MKKPQQQLGPRGLFQPCPALPCPALSCSEDAIGKHGAGQPTGDGRWRKGGSGKAGNNSPGSQRTCVQARRVRMPSTPALLRALLQGAVQRGYQQYSGAGRVVPQRQQVAD